MIRQLRFIGKLFSMRLSHLMVFRLSFFGAFFVDGTLFAIQILMFSAIYAHTDTIGGWGRGEMLVFIGTFSLINALNMVIYFFGVIGMQGLIRDGGLDHYMTKPMNTLLRISLERIDLGSLPLVFASIGVIGYGVSQLHIPLSAGRVLGYVILVLLMTLLYYDIEVILRTIPFFVISASGIERVEGELLVMCMKVPGICFHGVFKVLFYFVIPYGIMSTLPTQFLVGMLSPAWYAYGVAAAVGFTAFAIWFFKLGMRNYKSASS